jgi:hypothetical protein
VSVNPTQQFSLASASSTDTEASVSRRGFLMVSAGGLASLALTSVKGAWAAESELIQVSALWGFVGRFAVAVGSGVVANYISDYIRNQQPNWLTRQIQAVNDFMYKDGFTDFSRSRVFHGNGKIFYPVVHQDGFNTCVAFHDIHNEDPAVPLVEGPTVIGLTWAAEEMARRTSSQNARSVFHPSRSITRGLGTFQTSYAQPDAFQTVGGGRVAMNYRNDGPGRGTVAVLAEGPINRTEWGTLFDRQYSFRYS